VTTGDDIATFARELGAVIAASGADAPTAATEPAAAEPVAARR